MMIEAMDEEQEPPHSCNHCGQPSWVDPRDQNEPADYCHPEDHGL